MRTDTTYFTKNIEAITDGGKIFGERPAYTEIILF